VTEREEAVDADVARLDGTLEAGPCRSSFSFWPRAGAYMRKEEKTPIMYMTEKT